MKVTLFDKKIPILCYNLFIHSWMDGKEGSIPDEI